MLNLWVQEVTNKYERGNYRGVMETQDAISNFAAEIEHIRDRRSRGPTFQGLLQQENREK